MSARVIAPGPQTTLQGAPRFQYRHRGVPWAGAADPVSLSIANRLVSNPSDALALEVTFGGLSLAFDEPAHIGLAGAIASVTVDGEPVPFHETVHVSGGQTLSLAAPAAGLRTYIAIAGGWIGQEILGSASTYLPAALGGFEGRSLKLGDCLSWKPVAGVRQRVSTPVALRPVMQNTWVLRATPSAEFDWLDQDSQRRLFSERFMIGRVSNRMGVRLDSATLSFVEQKQLQSAPVFPATVQCPPSGAPILLLADGQTTGGYPRVCQIIRADRHLIGQLRPGDRLRLLIRSEDDARDAYIRKAALLNQWLDGMHLY